MPPTVAETLRDTAAQLKAAGIATPALEARLLLAHAAGLDPDALLRNRDAPAPAARLQPLLARRLTHEPLAFITGRTGFWTLDLEVSPATLIPRPDSETLVEAVLAARPYRDAVRRVLDLGTGTGCLLLATLSEYPLAWGLGTDLSPAAAALARRNAAATGLAARTAFTAANWAAPSPPPSTSCSAIPPTSPVPTSPVSCPKSPASNPAAPSMAAPTALPPTAPSSPHSHPSSHPAPSPSSSSAPAKPPPSLPSPPPPASPTPPAATSPASNARSCWRKNLASRPSRLR